MTILVLVPYYLPGYRSGGPARSIANLVAHLGEDLHFVVVTSDRDAGDVVAYPDVVPGQRYRMGRADVIYLDAAGRRPDRVAALIRALRPDTLYLNSFFSPAFSINVMLLRRFGRIPRLPVVLAPRGEFSAGALRLKAAKKRAWLTASRLLGTYDEVLWQASSPLEAADIRHCVGAVERTGRSQVIVAPVIARADPSAVRHEDTGSAVARSKTAGRLRVVFLSRVSPKKNLLGALQVLGSVRGEVEFNIFGPVEDEKYWHRCRALMQRLPANVRSAYRGPVPAEQVPAVLAQHDLFFLPTLGENYGHAIREALAAGTPVLVSDQTPWRDLTSAEVGWDLPLDRPDAFRAVLESCIATDAATFARWSERAMRYACRPATDDHAVDASRRLFRAAASGSGVSAVGDGERLNAC